MNKKRYHNHKIYLPPLKKRKPQQQIITRYFKVKDGMCYKCNKTNREQCRKTNCFFHKILCDKIAKQQLYFIYEKTRLGYLKPSTRKIYQIASNGFQCYKLIVPYQLFYKQIKQLLLIIHVFIKENNWHFPTNLQWKLITILYQQSLKLVE